MTAITVLLFFISPYPLSHGREKVGMGVKIKLPPIPNPDHAAGVLVLVRLKTFIVLLTVESLFIRYDQNVKEVCYLVKLW